MKSYHVYQRYEQISVSCLPHTSPDRRHYTLFITWRGNGQYAVTDPYREEYCDEEGNYRMSLDAALTLATRQAHLMYSNGVLVTDHPDAVEHEYVA